MLNYGINAAISKNNNCVNTSGLNTGESSQTTLLLLNDESSFSQKNTTLKQTMTNEEAQFNQD